MCFTNSVRSNLTVQPTSDVIERLGRSSDKGLLDGVMVERLRNGVTLNIVAPRANLLERQQPKQPCQLQRSLASSEEIIDLRVGP